MFDRLPVLFRSAMYALRGGFLIRPLAIAMILGAAGAVLSSLEEAIPGISAWIPSTLFPSHQDPGVAQVILSSIATSIMTVVSIVFAILLMTLTLASTQFSPRILVGFVRDRTTQGTLGVFLGTFAYCMAALPAARSLPQPFVPIATVTGALLGDPAQGREAPLSTRALLLFEVPGAAAAGCGHDGIHRHHADVGQPEGALPRVHRHHVSQDQRGRSGAVFSRIGGCDAAAGASAPDRPL